MPTITVPSLMSLAWLKRFTIVLTLAIASTSIPSQTQIDDFIPDRVESAIENTGAGSAFLGALGVSEASAGWWSALSCPAAIASAVAIIGGYAYFFYSMGGVWFTMRALAAGALTGAEIIATIGVFPGLYWAIDKVVSNC